MELITLKRKSDGIPSQVTKQIYSLWDKKTKEQYEVVSGKVQEAGSPDKEKTHTEKVDGKSEKEIAQDKRKKLVENGKRLFDEGDFNGALKLFKEGMGLSPYPGLNVLINKAEEALNPKVKDAESDNKDKGQDNLTEQKPSGGETAEPEGQSNDEAESNKEPGSDKKDTKKATAKK